jgi:hypothetical protein
MGSGRLGVVVSRISAAERAIAALLVVALLALAHPASAQTAPAAPSGAVGPYGMAIQEWQGLSCLGIGVLGSTGVYVYSDVLTEILTGVAANPLVLVPLLATGFVLGCTAGANMGPGLLWLYRQW